MFTRCFLKDELKNKVCRVKFTKVSSGEERTMVCTLKEEWLPEEENKKVLAEEEGEHNKSKQINENILKVFDLEKREWRSFRIDSVISCEGILDNV